MKIIAFIGVLICCWSCDLSGKQELKSYYFPYENFFDPAIYKYIDDKNPDDIAYWYMQTSVVNSDTIFTTKLYDNNFIQVELFREKIVEDGAVVIEYTTMNDSITTYSKIGEKQVVMWEQEKNKSVNWSISYQSEYGDEKFFKSRYLIGVTGNKSFENVEYETVKFRDEFKREITNTEWSDSVKYFYYSYYSKGLGMIESEGHFPDGTSSHLYLDQILTLKEWEELKSTRYNKPKP